MNGDWHAALAYALTGERLAVAAAGTPDPTGLLAELAGLGWSGPRLAAAARVGRRMPDDLTQGLGAARFWAILSEIRRELGAYEAVAPAVRGRTEPTDADRRLAAERPPHW